MYKAHADDAQPNVKLVKKKLLNETKLMSKVTVNTVSHFNLQYLLDYLKNVADKGCIHFVLFCDRNKKIH